MLDAARDGDDVALVLTDAAAAEFLLGVRAVAEGVGIIQDSPKIVLSGSLATAESSLRHAILDLLNRHMSPTSITTYAPEDLATKASGLVRLICDQGERLAGLRTVLPVVIRRVH